MLKGLNFEGKKVAVNLATVLPEDVTAAVRQLSPRRLGVFLVAATNDVVGMYGNRFNSNEPNSRPNIHIQPYSQTAAGSIVVPVFKDAQGKLHVAVVHHKRKDGEQKVLRLSEGFMHPKGCPDLPGGLESEYQPNDNAEEAILKGVSHEVAYANHPAVKRESPDSSLFKTAIREVREEIALRLIQEQLTRLDLDEQDGKIHVIAAYFLADLNYPESEYSQATEPPPLTCNDPKEVDAAFWICPEEIEKRGEEYFAGDYKILKRYVVFMEHAIHEIRMREIRKITGLEVDSVAGLLTILAPFRNSADFDIAKSLNISNSEDDFKSELGASACLRHKKLIALAELYRDRIKGKTLKNIQPITLANLDHIHSSISKPRPRRTCAHYGRAAW